MQAPSEPIPVVRERVEGLMLFRVVLVTFFLGGALLLDVGVLADFSSARNAMIVGLIVGTYALTILYGLLLRGGVALYELVAMQLTLDVITIGTLVDVYGGIDSPFLFLFLFTVISAALTLNRRAAMYTALAVTGMLLVLAAQRIGLFADEPASGLVWKNALFRVALNGSASLIVALLAGYLTELLGQATTQLEEQAESLRELRVLNDNILESLASGLLTVDESDTIIFFNRAAEQITHLKGTDVLGRPLQEVLPAIAEVLSGSPSPRRESELVRDDGSAVFLGLSTSPLVGPVAGAGGRIVIFQDLSDIKDLEAQVRRSERLAAVGRLSAAIAHEIRNPLASISGSVEMLSTDSALPEDDVKLLQIILREVDRLNTLVSDFLEYSRPRSLKLLPQSAASTVATVLGLFRPNGEVEVEADIADDLPLVDLDGEAFEQVLWNLLNNANEAVLEADPARIRVAVERNGDGVSVIVEDNGAGIGAADLDRVFQPFFTTKTQGTGLGLATIFRIVEAHNARVIASSGGTLGGARFEVVFKGSAGASNAGIRREA